LIPLSTYINSWSFSLSEMFIFGVHLYQLFESITSTVFFSCEAYLVFDNFNFFSTFFSRAVSWKSSGIQTSSS
jgi:hypothetical protein